jgi:hypothetical protein
MPRIALWGWLSSIGVLAACSSEGGPTSSGSGGSGTTATVSSSASGGTGGASSSASSGTGGAIGCDACETIAALPPGSAPHGIFADGANVYWTNSGTGEVMQANPDGTGAVTLATGEDTPYAVQSAGGFVYWVSYSVIGVMRRAPVGGGPIVDLTPAPAAREIVVGQSFIWWTREPDDIQRIPLAGLDDGGVPDLLSANLLSNGLASDGAHIYWCNRQDGYVKKGDLDLSNETALGNGDVPWDVAVDATNIYWTERSSVPGLGRVMRASKVDGSDTAVIADTQGGPTGIAIDTTTAYWANTDEGTIYKAPLAGGAVTLLAGGQEQPVNVAVDATHVYWANTAGDRVVRIAK